MSTTPAPGPAPPSGRTLVQQTRSGHDTARPLGNPAPGPRPEAANLLQLVIEPGPGRDHTFATVDVTAQEPRVEAFFPADDDTSDRWTGFARQHASVVPPTLIGC